MYRWRRRGFSHRRRNGVATRSRRAAAPLPKNFWFATIDRSRGTARADHVRHDGEDNSSRTAHRAPRPVHDYCRRWQRVIVMKREQLAGRHNEAQTTAGDGIMSYYFTDMDFHMHHCRTRLRHQIMVIPSRDFTFRVLSSISQLLPLVI